MNRTSDGRVSARWRILFALLLMHFCAGQGVSAQGVRGSLPDPISTADVLRFGDQLELSQSQLQAVFAMHDQYKSDFRALRSGEIAQYKGRMIKRFQAERHTNPKEMISVRREIETLGEKIESLDRNLLDKMTTVLTPDQVSRMARIRMARQRDCIEVSSTNLRVVLNISALARKLGLLANYRQAIDPLLGAYEQELTAIVIKLREIDLSTGWGRYDSLRAHGLTDEDLDDPSAADKVAKAENAMWIEAERKNVALLNEAAELNLRTCRSLVSLLPAETARTLRNAFYKESYGLAFDDGEAILREALKIESLTPSQRHALVAARDELHAAIDVLLEDGVAFQDRYRRETAALDMTDEQLRQQKVREFQEQWERLQAHAQEAQQAALEVIATTLGPELSEKIRIAATEAPASDIVKMRRALFVSDELNDDQSKAELESVRHLPLITKREFDGFAAQLRLGQEHQARLAAIHQAYLDRMGLIVENEQAAAEATAQSMHQVKPEGGLLNLATPEIIDKLNRQQTAVVEAIDAAGKALFDDLAALAPGEEHKALLDRLRLMYQRRVLARNTMAGADDRAIDLAAFVKQRRIDASELDAIDPILVSYEVEATEAFRSMYRAEMEWRRAMGLWQLERDSGQADEGTPRTGELAQSATERRTTAAAMLIELNRRTMKQLIEALSSDTGFTLRTAFNLRTNQKVYDDPTSVERHIHEAMKRRDLSESQRIAIETLAAEYRPAYADVCEKMDQASAEHDAPGALGDDSHENPTTREREIRSQDMLAILQFDRDELNQRAAVKLKWILSEPQLRGVGGLPSCELGR
jgi:hypothetical protein